MFIRIKHVHFAEVFFCIWLTKGTLLEADTCICSCVSLWVAVI